MKSIKNHKMFLLEWDGCCIWLKREFMDTTAINIANVMGTVNLLGYVLEEATDTSPRVIKAMAIYT